MNDELDILLVEDDLDTRANLTDILELDSHRICVAGCLEEVRKSGLQPDIDLVFLDRRLPGGDADDALPELKRLLPNAEFIVVTGYGDMENTITAFKLGAVDYITKPIHPDAIRGSIARIARQRRTDRELREEQCFANELHRTAEAIILVLDPTGRILRLNPYFTQVTGWEASELIGRDWFDTCIAQDDREWVREVFMTTAHNVNTSGVLNPVLRSDGRLRQIRWSNTTLKNIDGEVTSVLAIGVDVTDLIEAQEQALQSQRLAAIGQTVTGLAHESRNALHRIQASVEILKLDIPLDSDSREEVESIERASLELNKTLEEVRQYAAPIQLQRETALLPELWRRVWGYLSPLHCGRDAQLVETHCDCECPVDVDVLRLEQVFRNLFENALSACEDPVRIHVHCRCDGPDAVLVEIQDNGTGLSSEQRSRIFEPFYTTKSRGTGLGMSIVQRIVEAHGGSIEVVEPNAPDAKIDKNERHGARLQIQLAKPHEFLSMKCCDDVSDSAQD